MLRIHPYMYMHEELKVESRKNVSGFEYFLLDFLSFKFARKKEPSLHTQTLCDTKLVFFLFLTFINWSHSYRSSNISHIHARSISKRNWSENEIESKWNKLKFSFEFLILIPLCWHPFSLYVTLYLYNVKNGKVMK